MDSYDISVLEKSFKVIASQQALISERFYDRLFQAAPSLRSMFPEDMTQQRSKLMASLGSIVASLRSSADLKAILAGLRARHIGYGADNSHYEIVGNELLSAIDDVLGDAFTDEYRKVWTIAYGHIMDAMKS